MATEDTAALTRNDMLVMSSYQPSDSDTITSLRHFISLSEALRADLFAKGAALIEERDHLKVERDDLKAMREFWQVMRSENKEVE